MKKTIIQSNKKMYNIILRSELEGGYTVTVPSLPGCISYGKNLAEAKLMISDAIKLYVESLKAHKEIIPTDTETYISSLEVAYA